MTRVLLTIGLALATLAVGLWTAVVSSYNHQRGTNLSDLQRRLEILRAAGDQAEAEAAAHVWGRAQLEPAEPAAPPPAEEQEARP